MIREITDVLALVVWYGFGIARLWLRPRRMSHISSVPNQGGNVAGRIIRGKIGGRIKGVNVLQSKPDKPAVALSTSGVLRAHEVARPKAVGIPRLFSGSRRQGGGRLHGASSIPKTILSGNTDHT